MASLISAFSSPLEAVNEACREGNWGKFQTGWAEVIAATEPSKRTFDRQTALEWALSAPARRAQDRLKIVGALLDDGADPNAVADNGDVILGSALGANWDPDLLRMLIAAGALPFQPGLKGRPSALVFAAKNHDAAALKILLSVRNNDLASLWADQINKALLETLDTRAGSNWPISVESRQRRAAYEVVELLLAAGADPTVTDVDGRNVFGRAARTEDPGIIAEVFSYRKSNESVTPASGRSVLQEAISSDQRFNAAAFAVLVKVSQTPLDATDRDGNTALHEAVRRGNDEAVLDLLRRGADPLIRNSRGMRAIDISDGDLDEGTYKILEGRSKDEPSEEPENAPAQKSLIKTS